MAGKSTKKTLRLLPFITLAVFLIFMITAFAVSLAVFELPVAAVGMLFVLACVLAALLDQIPIWIHGLVFIGMIVVGVGFSQLPVMIFTAFIYFLAVMLLFTWTRNYK